MFVVLNLQLYIYVYFYSQVFNCKPIQQLQGEVPVDVYYFIFISIYLYLLKYIYVPTIYQVFSLILWLYHHSVAFLVLAPIMGSSCSTEHDRVLYSVLLCNIV